jgi:hypothetical protein
MYLNALYAIAASEYWTLEELQGWADAIIAQVKSPKPWLCSLSLSQSFPEAKSAILMELLGVGDYDSELVIGFFYLKYLKAPLLKEVYHMKIFNIYDARFALEEHELETEKNKVYASWSQKELDYLVSPELVSRELDSLSY